MGEMNLKYNKGGYLVVYILLIGLLSLSLVSSNNNLDWVSDVIKLAPGPVVLVTPSNEVFKDCGDESTDECLKKLQTFLRLKSLPFPTDVHKLNKLCSETVAGYNCSARKMAGPKCLSTKDKDTLPVFIDMAQYTMYMFCSYGQGKGYLGEGMHGYLREDILEHSECILKHKESLECCAEGSKLMDLPVMYFLDQSSRSLAERQADACCPVAEYLRCVRTIIRDSCGEVAGNLTTEYIRRSSGEKMESACQQLPGYPEPTEEFCKTSPFVCAGCSKTETFLGISILIFLFFVVFMNPL